ncbi:von Willebrand factor type A domain-containing protein [Prosthecobacter debontii]|uniref:von Willebrand factor type A domain-containing protein n=1 Tax=Prosthecobacter debontii TaxID=48467 RepID=A0A1T4YQL9_9BACT|nr:VWA domain-containing protein [Prosthecobacter debontii]SKB03551.1 von Willebrand factor type A domain-containing protein [Prosthecobacter debontii]
MDWESPKLLILALPALALLLWIENRSVHPMEGLRKRLLLVVRTLGLLLALLALAGPARVAQTGKKALGIVLDASQSLGEEGRREALKEAREMQGRLGMGTESFIVMLGDEPALLPDVPEKDQEAALGEFQQAHGGDSQYSAAIEYAQALFPAGASRDIVMIGDGHETRGSLIETAQDASLAGVRLHARALAGPKKPDARVLDLVPSRSRLNEGATLKLTAHLESTLNTEGMLKLYENGIQVEQRPVTLQAGQSLTETFTRTPNERNIFKYRAVLEGITADTLPANNSALTLVDVRGRLRLLYLDSEPAEAQYLQQAMEKEGIELDLRQPGNIPASLEQLAGYDGIILSDVSAHRLGEGTMNAMRDYVDKLGGGFLMLGGPNSFALGGFYKTPIDDLLPVRLKAPDEEEKQSAAVAIVMDRSGSMAGEKLEMAKSASIATAEVLGRNDFIGVYAFDSEAHVVVPMTRLTSTAAVAGQIAAVASGGGTNLQPAFEQARDALRRVKAKVKHMIILTDGQTSGSGYESMASQCRGEGITISTVSIGEGSHVALLQAIASSGGGQSYTTLDASGITRIFTQDTLMHTGRMLREDPFLPQLVEKHAMLAGFEPWNSPDLLGYVKTIRKATAQVPLVTDAGDPLLAHWRYGLGKVTAFTSDAKSRWAGLWIARWPDFNCFWSQVLRETARPPQGRHMDLAVEMQGDRALMHVDLQEDAGTRANDARVQAEVFFVAADSLGAPLKSVQNLLLGQTGPGLYEGHFRPDQPGVYLVRAQSGAEMVSAGVVHNPSNEASLGTVNEGLLKKATQLTQGQILKAGELPDLSQTSAVQYIELWPPLVLALLLLFLADVAIRRWEHVQGIWEVIRDLLLKKAKKPSGST